jgi:hypothetical protein
MRIFLERIDYTDLPSTFRDATQVVRALGISFVWINSICIVQEDPDHISNQQNHVSAMA